MSNVHAPNVGDHVDAFREALVELELFDYGSVPGLKDSKGRQNPGKTPAIYALATVERLSHDNGLMARRSRRTMWRASIRAVGKDFPGNCRVAMSRLLELENAQLVIDDLPTTPLVVESAEDATPDDGWYSALIRFTYAT